MGLDKESVLYLDIMAGGSFTHKIPMEGKEILDHILENMSFVGGTIEPLLEAKSSSDELPTHESEPSTPTSLDSTVELSPEPQKGKELLALEFSFAFEEDLFEDFRNTSNYSCKPKPPVPVSTPDPLEEEFLRETIKELTTIMSDEWLRKVELSPNVLQICSPSTTIRCKVRGAWVDVLYNPTVGANLISTSFALAILGEDPLAATDKSFKSPSGLILEGFGILHSVGIMHGDVEAFLDFHVFKVHDFNLLIGHPIEKLRIDASTLNDLNLKLGGKTFSVPISRSRNALMDFFFPRA